MRRALLTVLALAGSAVPAFAGDPDWLAVPSIGTDGRTNLVNVDANHPLPVATTGYPQGSVAVTNSVTGTTASVAASLPAVAGKTNYICGWSVDADATAAAVGSMTVSGVINGPLARFQNVGAASAGVASTWANYAPCLPASAVNTAIVVTSASAGAGGNTAVDVWGYVQ